MHRFWPGFEFDDWRRAKLAKRGIYNVGLMDWQILLCPEDRYADIARRVRERGMGLSVHHPYVSPRNGLDRSASSLFLHADKSIRDPAFDWLEDSVARAAETGARFVVTHLADAPDAIPLRQARSLALAAAGRMASMADRHDVEVHVEFLGYHETFHGPAEFARIMESHPTLKLCLDTGHLHRWSQMRGGDALAAAKTLAPHVDSMHVWNISSAKEFAERGHIPVHPSQREEDGYADVRGMIECVYRANRDVSIIFEPTIRQDTSEQFVAEGIAWVQEIVNGSSRKTG